MKRVFQKSLTCFSSSLNTILFLLLFSVSIFAKENNRIVAVGDIHGDLEALVAILKSRSLINDQGDWAGGTSELVITGDLNDRGTDTRTLFDYLMDLELQAQAHLGKVHVLLGNHELMWSEGDYRYVTKEEKKTFKNLKKTFQSDSKYSRWFRQHNALLKWKDSLFLHGGISSDQTFKNTLLEFNQWIKDWLGFYQKVNKSKPPKQTSWVISGEGFLWDRKMAGQEISPEFLEKVLNHFKVKRIILGHTPQNQITFIYQGKVILIDTGATKIYGGRLSSLEILDDESIPNVKETQRTPESEKLRKILVEKYFKLQTQ